MAFTRASVDLPTSSPLSHHCPFLFKLFIFFLWLLAHRVPLVLNSLINFSFSRLHFIPFLCLLPGISAEEPLHLVQILSLLKNSISNKSQILWSYMGNSQMGPFLGWKRSYSCASPKEMHLTPLKAEAPAVLSALLGKSSLISSGHDIPAPSEGKSGAF